MIRQTISDQHAVVCIFIPECTVNSSPFRQMILSQQLVCADERRAIIFLATNEREGKEQEYCKDKCSHGDFLFMPFF